MLDLQTKIVGQICLFICLFICLLIWLTATIGSIYNIFTNGHFIDWVLGIVLSSLTLFYMWAWKEINKKTN